MIPSICLGETEILLELCTRGGQFKEAYCLLSNNHFYIIQPHILLWLNENHLYHATAFYFKMMQVESWIFLFFFVLNLKSVSIFYHSTNFFHLHHFIFFHALKYQDSKMDVLEEVCSVLSSPCILIAARNNKPVPLPHHLFPSSWQIRSQKGGEHSHVLPVVHEEYILMYFHVIFHVDNFLFWEGSSGLSQRLSCCR